MFTLCLLRSMNDGVACMSIPCTFFDRSQTIVMTLYTVITSVAGYVRWCSQRNYVFNIYAAVYLYASNATTVHWFVNEHTVQSCANGFLNRFLFCFAFLQRPRHLMMNSRPSPNAASWSQLVGLRMCTVQGRDIAREILVLFNLTFIFLLFTSQFLR